jgi:uncharacterized protein YaiI (UPF0178 family)
MDRQVRISEEAYNTAVQLSEQTDRTIKGIIENLLKRAVVVGADIVLAPNGEKQEEAHCER